jgi:hypothetical protein
MKIDKLVFKDEDWIIVDSQILTDEVVDIIFVFGHINSLKSYNHFSLLKSKYPDANIVGCSTAGNILDTTIDKYEVIATAISFDTAKVKVFSTHLFQKSISQDTFDLVNSIEKEGLKHLFILSPGLINGSEIVEGIKVDKNITVSGALAGDEDKFESTYLFFNEKKGSDLLIAICFYGDSIHTSVGCDTGWNEFGATRVVTKSKKNIIYEIDNKPAIELYEKYLGNSIDSLPNSALRFPLSIRDSINDENEIILVMMDINSDKSLVYAGNIKEGSIIKLMKTNVSNLLEGASLSAKRVKSYNEKESLSLVISCAARRSVLKQFSEEEVEVVKEILPLKTQIIGFYSYGEIAPFSNELSKSLLHNQTMTITTIYED